MSAQDFRLAELIGGLSLATDSVAGMPQETALRTSLLAVRLGRRLKLDSTKLRDVFYTALLRFIGCTAYAAETARIGGGDDQTLLRSLTVADTARPLTALKAVSKGKGLRGLRQVASLMQHTDLPQRLATTHCELAIQLAPRLGVTAGVVDSLGHIYER